MAGTTSRAIPSAMLARLCLAAAVAGLLPYLLLPAKPLVYDAPMAILANEPLHGGPLSRLFVVDFWGIPAGAEHASGSYRPLVGLTWAIQARTLGDSAALYHATDMALHALASAAVVWLISILGLGRRACLLGGLLFALHPLQSEAVASVVGRADILAALALLVGLAAHLAAPERRHPWIWRAGAVLALGAGLLCKEYAVAFPFIVVAVDLGRRRAGRLPAEAHRREPVVWAAAFALLAGYLLLRYRLFGALGGVPMLEAADHPLHGQPLVARLSTAAALLALAGRLVVLPYGLNHHYRFGTLPIAEGPLDPRAIAGLLLLALVVATSLFWLRSRRDPIPWIAVSLFVLPLAPALNTVSLSGVLFAERLLYLPIAGVALLFAWAVERIPEARLPGVGVRRALLAAACLLLGGITALRVEAWSSEERLARSSLAAYPNGSEVREALGYTLSARGLHEQAVVEYERALATNPSHPRTWKRYADSLMALGRHDEAAAAWRRVIELSPPEIGLLWRGLGQAELKAGRAAPATEALARAHALMPADPTSLYYLGLAWLRADDPGAAVDALRAGREAMANDPEALEPLYGQALLRSGQRRLLEGRADVALDLAREAVALGALPPDGQFLAGLLARRAGASELGRRWLDEAIARDAGLLGRKREAARRLLDAGRVSDAAALLDEVLEAAPGDAEALRLRRATGAPSR